MLSRLGDSLYRVLLLVLPARLRNEFGVDMAQLFSDQRRAARRQPWRLVRLWMAAARDVMREAAAERRLSAASSRPLPSLGAMSRMLITDFRHGLRLVRRYPGSSLLAVATLALGIGANTAIFSVVDAVLLRALPYDDPDRLVMVWEKRPREGRLQGPVSAADYLDWRRMNTMFESMAGFAPVSLSLTGDGEPVQIPAAVVGWNFFDMLGVAPEAGRAFRAGDEIYGQHRAAIVSHGFWQRRYGGDRNIVGRRITVNGNDNWTIVGVLPRGFRFVDIALNSGKSADRYDIWVPLVLEAPGDPPSRTWHDLSVYARLKSGVTLTQADDAMDRLGRQLEQAHPVNIGHGAHVTAMQEEYARPARSSLMILLAAVALVLLITCVNIASLLLVRAAARRREMAVRSALGAGRWRLGVQVLTESVALSLAGGALGLAVAYVLMTALPVVLPAHMSVVSLDELHLDARLLGFAFVLALITGLMFGLLPALQSSRLHLTDALGEGARGAGGVRHHARKALVIGEVALAAITLVGAGLVLRSFAHILAQPLGFDTKDRLAVTLALPAGRYTTPDARRLALDQLERALAAVPGVRSIGGIDLLPLGGGDARRGVGIEGREPKPGDPPTRMHPRIVTPGYFRVMAIPLVSGRGFQPTDDERSEPVVVINQTAARRFWGNEDPIGRRIVFGGTDIRRTIVGIAGDVRHWGLTGDVNPMVYLPQAQMKSSALTFVLRADVDPETLAGAVRARVTAFDPNLPIAGLRTLDRIRTESTESERALTVLMTAFGVLALLLALIGIYGVTAQLVATRVREIGVRMTLGARPGDILRQLFAENLRQTVAGLVLGLAAGAWLMRFGETLLFGVEPADPLTLAGVSGVLVLAGLAATVVPARRAMSVDPAKAIRDA